MKISKIKCDRCGRTVNADVEDDLGTIKWTDSENHEIFVEFGRGDLCDKCQQFFGILVKNFLYGDSYVMTQSEIKLLSEMFAKDMNKICSSGMISDMKTHCEKMIELGWRKP
jgi:hypothetical protein